MNMKKIITMIFLVLTTITVVSCQEEETPIYQINNGWEIEPKQGEIIDLYKQGIEYYERFSDTESFIIYTNFDQNIYRSFMLIPTTALCYILTAKEDESVEVSYIANFLEYNNMRYTIKEAIEAGYLSNKAVSLEENDIFYNTIMNE